MGIASLRVEMGNSGLLLFVSVLAASCINKEYQVTETYHETEFRTEYKTESYSETYYTLAGTPPRIPTTVPKEPQDLEWTKSPRRASIVFVLASEVLAQAQRLTVTPEQSELLVLMAMVLYRYAGSYNEVESIVKGGSIYSKYLTSPKVRRIIATSSVEEVKRPESAFWSRVSELVRNIISTPYIVGPQNGTFVHDGSFKYTISSGEKVTIHSNFKVIQVDDIEYEAKALGSSIGNCRTGACLIWRDEIVKVFEGLQSGTLKFKGKDVAEILLNSDGAFLDGLSESERAAYDGAGKGEKGLKAIIDKMKEDTELKKFEAKGAETRQLPFDITSYVKDQANRGTPQGAIDTTLRYFGYAKKTVTKERQVPYQVPYQVEKQRTVTKTKKVPVWDLIFGK